MQKPSSHRVAGARQQRARHATTSSPLNSGIFKAHLTLEDVERAYVQQVLARSPTLKKAAKRLGVHFVTLWRMRKRWGL